MSIYNPIKRSQTRSMNRGDSKVEFAHDGGEDYHRSMADYHEQKGKGHEATAKRYVKGSAGYAQHQSQADYHALQMGLHLKRLKGGTKLSVSAGAAMDPAVKVRKEQNALLKAGDAVATFALPKRYDMADVLKHHGYKHVGTSDGHGGEEHLYQHPKGHTASHWLGNEDTEEREHHQMPEVVYHAMSKSDKHQDAATDHVSPRQLHAHLTKIHGTPKK